MTLESKETLTSVNGIDCRPLMVTIRCITYNHEPYIRKCLEGFVMQKTNFRFEAIVHDDASTDGTAAIIREFAEKHPDIIKPIYETENQYSKKDGSLRRIMEKHTHGKYVAFCEGDDYWIDPMKLQKQVDYLEGHQEMLMSHTGFNCIDENGYVINRPYYDELKKMSGSGDVFKTLMLRNTVMTLTTMYRKEVFDFLLYKSAPSHYDYTLSLAASLMGKVGYIPDITGLYRRTPGSLIVSHKKEVSKALDDVYIFFVSAFLNGEGMQRSLISRIQIKINILICLYPKKKRLVKLLFVHKTLFFLLPIVFILLLVEKISKKYHERKKSISGCL